MQRHLAILFILALSLSMAAGCGALVAGGAAAAGTYVYTEGRLQQQYEANLDQAFQASLAGARDAGLKVTEQNKEVAEASIRAEQQDGSPVWITLESLDQNKTQVSVRVGYTGDEQASRRIQEAIATRF